MMYCTRDFPTKKALKAAVAAGETVTIFSPGAGLDGEAPRDGRAAVGGPHFPRPHTWYAQVEMRDGRVVRVS